MARDFTCCGYGKHKKQGRPKSPLFFINCLAVVGWVMINPSYASFNLPSGFKHQSRQLSCTRLAVVLRAVVLREVHHCRNVLHQVIHCSDGRCIVCHCFVSSIQAACGSQAIRHAHVQSMRNDLELSADGACITANCTGVVHAISSGCCGASWSHSVLCVDTCLHASHFAMRLHVKESLVSFNWATGEVAEGRAAFLTSAHDQGPIRDSWCCRYAQVSLTEVSRGHVSAVSAGEER